MSAAEELIDRVRPAFASSRYPGDQFLLGKGDGCEPYDVVSNFFGKSEWWELPPEFLDAHYDALSFFSEAGFRYFLPAYLVADLRDQLKTADPTFHLTHGFHASAFDYQRDARTFVRRSGGGTLLNPRRYGAMTWQDHAQCRLSAFCREECAIIAEYLRIIRVRDAESIQIPAIDAALSRFWDDRVKSAPTGGELDAFLAEETEFQAALASTFKFQFPTSKEK